MPRPCAVEPHVRCYKGTSGGFADATARGRGIRESCTAFFVVASVRLHGARPWHLEERERERESRAFCSGERETPRREAVASSFQLAYDVLCEPSAGLGRHYVP